ncbi:carboxylate--amine ligase [Sphingopyxis sp. 550A]
MTRDRGLPPAIVLGVDSSIGLTVVRELGAHGVPVIAAGRSRWSIGGHSRYARQHILRPRGVPLADWLPEVVAASGAGAVIPISEADLLELADMPPAIGGCRIASPRHEQLDLVLDKLNTLARARETGIEVPDTWQPLAGQDFEAKAADIAYPVILKWSDPPAMWERLEAAGIDFEKAERADGAEALVAILRRYDPLGVYPLVQSWCQGYGFGQMLMMEGGRATLRFQHERLREYPASGGISTLCRSVPLSDHRAQMEKSEALLRAIGWEGPAMVEYRHDAASGRYWLMEVNGRLWGSLPLASQSGAHFAFALYRRLVDGVAGQLASGYRDHRARYVLPDTKRLVDQLRAKDLSAGEKLREMATYAADFFRFDTGYYVAKFSDPVPTLADLAGIIARLLGSGS